MAIVVAVIGRKKSGKTATAEFLVTNLAKEGFRIGALKHTHHHNFTFDTKGKDTWRFAQAGAKLVIGVSNNEVAIINKTTTLQQDLDQLLNLFTNSELDFIILEGFHTMMSNRKDIQKIITANDDEGLRQILPGTSPPILAIAGPIAKRRSTLENSQIPIIDIQTQGDRLIRILRRLLRKDDAR